MSYSQDAADRIVRLSAEGTKTALRITGAGASTLARMIGAALRAKGSKKGKEQLTRMLSGREEVRILPIHREDLKAFSSYAPKFGIDYVTLRSEQDDLRFLLVKASDAVRAGRILDSIAVSPMGKDEIEEVLARREYLEEIEEILPGKPKSRAEVWLLSAIGKIREGTPTDPFIPEEARSPSAPSLPKTKESPASERSEPDGMRRPSVREELEKLMRDPRGNGRKRDLDDLY